MCRCWRDPRLHGAGPHSNLCDRHTERCGRSVAYPQTDTRCDDFLAESYDPQTRARVRLAQRYAAGGASADWSTALTSPDLRTQEVLDRYVRAWETDDVHGLDALLREDATLAMPPSPTWNAGRDAIVRFLSATVLTGATSGLWRLMPAGANAQPAFLLYRRETGSLTPVGVQVLTLAPDHHLASITVFLEPRWVSRFTQAGSS